MPATAMFLRSACRLTDFCSSDAMTARCSHWISVTCRLLPLPGWAWSPVRPASRRASTAVSSSIACPRAGRTPIHLTQPCCGTLSRSSGSSFICFACVWSGLVGRQVVVVRAVAPFHNPAFRRNSPVCRRCLCRIGVLGPPVPACCVQAPGQPGVPTVWIASDGETL